MIPLVEDFLFYMASLHIQCIEDGREQGSADRVRYGKGGGRQCGRSEWKIKRGGIGI